MNVQYVPVLLIAQVLLNLSSTKFTEVRDLLDQVLQIVFPPSREIPTEASVQMDLRDLAAQVLQIVSLLSKEILIPVK